MVRIHYIVVILVLINVFGIKPLVSKGETVKASLKLTSPNGDQGFPGKLDVE